MSQLTHFTLYEYKWVNRVVALHAVCQNLKWRVQIKILMPFRLQGYVIIPWLTDLTSTVLGIAAAAPVEDILLNLPLNNVFTMVDLPRPVAPEDGKKRCERKMEITCDQLSDPFLKVTAACKLLRIPSCYNCAHFIIQ